MPGALDVTGQRFGRLTALEYVGRKKCRSKKLYQTQRLWSFRCDCGNVVTRKLNHVRTGNTLSCGCLQKEALKRTNEKITLEKGESSFNGLYKVYQRIAMNRHHEWEISKELFRRLTKENCHYCGSPPVQSFLSNKQSNGEYIYMGLDRIFNDQGYSPNNVVPCCGICNWAKHTLSRQEFLLLVERIYKHCISGKNV